VKEKKTRTVKLNYTLTMDDVLAFLRYHFRNSPKMKRTFFLYRTLIPAVICAVLAMALTNNFSESFSWETAAILAVCYGLAFAVIPMTMKRSIERATKRMYTRDRQKDLLGQHKTVLDGESVTDESRFGTARYEWGAVLSAPRTEGHLFLYVSPESAMIIPLKGLGKGSKRDSLFQLVDEVKNR
jgi:hypothetical protein